MPIICVENVVKEFRTPKRQPGLLGGLRTLFTRQYTVKRALDGVNFMVDEGELLGYIAEYAPHRVLVVQFTPNGASPLVEDGAVDIPGTEFVRREDGKVWLRFDPARVAVPALIAEVTARYPVSDLSIVEPELGHVIRQIYEERQVVV